METENKVWRNLYPELGGKTLKPQVSVDDVRITKTKKTLDKDHSKMDGRGFSNF